MPRRSYVRIENGVPVFPINPTNPVLPGETGDLIVGPNGQIVGRRMAAAILTPSRSETVNEPVYRTMSIGSIGRIGTASAPLYSDTGPINPPLGYMVPNEPVTPGTVSVSFPEVGIVNPDILEDFERMHGGEPEAVSALDQLLEDDDDPIPEG